MRVPRKQVDLYFTSGFDEGIDTAVDTPRDGGKPIHWDCKGILVYKRQKNGEWLIFRDIWNNNKPPRS